MKNNEFVITRTFDAPREKIWQAWTKPSMFKKWWGPKGFTAPIAQMDLREGGKYFNCMRSPEGKDYCGTGKYLKVMPQEKLVYSDSFADKKGNAVSADYYGMDANWPKEMKVEATFEDAGMDKTKFTLRYPDIVSKVNKKDLEDMDEGWNQSLDKLDRLISG